MNLKIISLIFLFSNSFAFKTRPNINKPIVTNNNKLNMNLESCGMDLAVGTFISGVILDNTISKNSTKQVELKKTKLYIKGYKKVFKNIMILGPLYFGLVNKFILNNYHSFINPFQITLLILIHNLGYYIAHKTMHKIKYFKRFHNFHHRFNDIVFPSTGNAVSEVEFTFAYMFPFIIGAYLIRPSVESYKFAIGLISLFNLIIHCEELREIEYKNYLVSPFNHTEHHRVNKIKNTYAAPILNIDFLINKSEDLKKEAKEIFDYFIWGLNTYFKINI